MAGKRAQPIAAAIVKAVKQARELREELRRLEDGLYEEFKGFATGQDAELSFNELVAAFLDSLRLRGEERAVVRRRLLRAVARRRTVSDPSKFVPLDIFAVQNSWRNQR